MLNQCTLHVGIENNSTVAALPISLYTRNITVNWETMKINACLVLLSRTIIKKYTVVQKKIQIINDHRFNHDCHKLKVKSTVMSHWLPMYMWYTMFKLTILS